MLGVHKSKALFTLGVLKMKGRNISAPMEMASALNKSKRFQSGKLLRRMGLASLLMLSALEASAVPADNSDYCDFLVEPSYYQEGGSFNGTWDPEEYDVGDVIRTFDIFNERQGSMACQTDGVRVISTVRAFFQSNAEISGGAKIAEGASFYYADYPGFGLRLYIRPPSGGGLVIAPGGDTITFDMPGANGGGVPFNGAPSGLVGRIEIFKRESSASDLRLETFRNVTLFSIDESARRAADNDANGISDGVNGRSIILRAASKPSCTIDVPHVTVDGIVIRQNISGAVLAERPVKLEVACSGSAPVESLIAKIFMSDAFNPDNLSDRLEPSSTSGASGVVAEILRGDGQKVKFDPSGVENWVDPQQFGIGNYQIPFTVRLVRAAGQDLVPGQFEFQAAYNIVYF